MILKISDSVLTICPTNLDLHGEEIVSRSLGLISLLCQLPHIVFEILQKKKIFPWPGLKAKISCFYPFLLSLHYQN